MRLALLGGKGLPPYEYSFRNALRLMISISPVSVNITCTDPIRPVFII